MVVMGFGDFGVYMFDFGFFNWVEMNIIKVYEMGFCCLEFIV